MSRPAAGEPAATDRAGPRASALRFPEYDDLDATALAELVRRREVTAGELIDAALQRIERRNPALNAVIHVAEDPARARAAQVDARAPFAGVPFLLKDLGELLTGMPFRAGSRFLADYVPDHDSELTRRYLGAGFIPIGKTNTPEFGLTPYTEPARFGPTLNPWDPRRTAGGSSGGSAAAVAARLVPVASGGDGGGSIRIPASCCGLFGLKPTRGRTPAGPDVGQVWHGAVVGHVLTRSVRDSAAVLDATHGPDPGAPYFPPPPERPFAREVETDPARLRIAWTATPFLGSTVHPDCVRALDDAVALLQSLGHELVPAEPPVDGLGFARAFLSMIAAELNADIADAERVLGRRVDRGFVELSTWAILSLGRALRADELSVALRVLDRQARRVGEFFEVFDALLTPTLAVPPFETGALQPTARERMMLSWLARLGSSTLIRRADLLDEMASKVFDAIPYTPLFNATGQPAMSLPLFWNDGGLPIGVQVVGRYAREDVLFRLAGQLERARPWASRTPPA